MTETRKDEADERSKAEKKQVVTVSRIATLSTGIAFGAIVFIIFWAMNREKPPAEKTATAPSNQALVAANTSNYETLTRTPPEPEPAPRSQAPEVFNNLLQAPGEPVPGAPLVDTEAEAARVANPRFALTNRRSNQGANQQLSQIELQEQLMRLSLANATNAASAPGQAGFGGEAAALAQFAGLGQGGTVGAAGAGQGPARQPETSVETNLRFAVSGRQAEGDDGWSRYRLTAPKSRFELKPGTIINAALKTALNSDLPGDVVAKTTVDVRDSVAGRFILIPAVSTLIGKTNSAVGNGQDRLQVVWTRLILPNGKEIALDSLTGSDRSGAAGLADRVDYHVESIGLGVVLSTLLSVGGNLARGNASYDRYSLRQGIGDSVAQSVSSAGSRIVDRQLNIPPTITIREGTHVTATVMRTMILEPYQPAQ
jgi:type IV secretion system protein VirB10